MKKRFNEKKWILGLTALAMTAGLFGCGEQKEPDAQMVMEELQETQPQEVETEQAQPQEVETEQAQPEEAETDKETADAQTLEEEKSETVQEIGDYVITRQETTDTQTCEDGTVIYRYTERSWPQVTNAANPQAAEKINAYFTAFMITTSNDDAEVLECAKEDYERCLEEAEELEKDTEGIYWQPYYSGISFTNARIDEEVICFIGDCYEYTGGAYGNHVSYGITFDSHTGERLMLADLTEDKIAARAFLEEQITVQAQEIDEKTGGGLFDEYMDYIPDVLTENSWYLTTEGLEIVANEYLLAPHAAGVIRFTIPYEMCEFMKEEYKK